ncbi:hypothetical protein Q4Q34_19400 [Flavivirga abyssicola]|uniref:hypothetical protein n=1 Tax=Flavivirga abyssicola TaxID=3063533 RepID=UPI0026E05C31|nr:hypothetical protein [Flavivirga sp. MEBiC07777]WVK13383.1 hypothetical protein Q4Q34_19400 [Flavivirga sp. MEBiC07777]
MKKYKKLVLSIVLDVIGYISFVIPGIGEFSDIIWAPLSGYIMTRLYKGNAGKIAGVIAFTEEALPGLDVVPTFTLMWLYTYVFKKKEEIIEV